MKHQIGALAFSFMMMTAVVFTTAATDQDKGNNKGQQQKQDKSAQGKPDKKDKGQPAQNEKANRGNAGQKNQGKSEKGQGKSDAAGNRGKSDIKDDKPGKDVFEEKGKRGDAIYGKSDKSGVFRWDRETFKNRDNIRKGEKVTLCHKFDRSDEPPVTITVSSNALNAHLNHGDNRGECPAVTEKRYSDDFLRTRTEYYNDLQQDYEQYLYSRSILDYALTRLNDSRQQLIILQRNNAPAADIQRKQVVVMELEQNVSLLESLIGVAANLVVNKLTN